MNAPEVRSGYTEGNDQERLDHNYHSKDDHRGVPPLGALLMQLTRTRPVRCVVAHCPSALGRIIPSSAVRGARTTEQPTSLETREHQGHACRHSNCREHHPNGPSNDSTPLEPARKEHAHKEEGQYHRDDKEAQP